MYIECFLCARECPQYFTLVSFSPHSSTGRWRFHLKKLRELGSVSKWEGQKMAELKFEPQAYGPKAHISLCHKVHVYRHRVEGFACYVNYCELHWHVTESC